MSSGTAQAGWQSSAESQAPLSHRFQQVKQVSDTAKEFTALSCWLLAGVLLQVNL